MNGYALSGVLLIIAGIIFLFLRVEWLTAGADALPEKDPDKRGFDLQKLCRMIGFFLIGCGLVFLVLAVTLH